MLEVPWSGDTLGSILESPVSWNVQVNGLQLQPEDELSYAIGIVVPLSVTITNISSNSLKQLQLLVQCFQDYQNGAKINRKSKKRNVIGSEKVNIDKVIQTKGHLKTKLTFPFSLDVIIDSHL